MNFNDYPKVATIIPTYKRPEALNRSIESVLKQTYNNIEIFVVDDNEPNSKYRIETENVMKDYIQIDNVKYVKHSKNKNGSAARNTGIRVSDSDYVAFLDDDDEFLPDRIDKLVKKMEDLEEEWGACYTSYIKYSKNNKVQYSKEKREGYLFIEALMRSIYIGSGSNLFVRRSAINKINGFDESFNRNQDLEFLARLLRYYKLAYIDSCSLLIYSEGKDTKMSYERIKEIDNTYTSKFKPMIDTLDKKEREKVYTMFALDSFKYSIYYKCISKGIKEINENNVSPYVFIKYVFYLIDRLITKKSYGFKI